MTVNGVIILNKRKGISSFRAVSEVKRAAGADKAGHTGTLDPEASGVLPVCLGKSTRISSYLMQEEKEYIVTMYIGIRSDTYDLEGSVEKSGSTSDISNEDIRGVLNGFLGKISQKPPVYSAIKVNGRKLYDYARKGEEVEIKPRDVEIKYIRDIEITESEYNGTDVISVVFTAGCSKGTYIRSLCNDIGEKLGAGALMAGLVRSASGNFRIEDSFTIEEIIEAFENDGRQDIILEPGKLTGLPVIHLDENRTEAYLLGKKVVITCDGAGDYLIKSNKGSTIGIGVVDGSGRLKSRKRLS